MARPANVRPRYRRGPADGPFRTKAGEGNGDSSPLLIRFPNNFSYLWSPHPHPRPNHNSFLALAATLAPTTTSTPTSTPIPIPTTHP